MNLFYILLVIVPSLVNCSLNSQNICSSVKTVNYTSNPMHVVRIPVTYTSHCINNQWHYVTFCTKTKTKLKLERSSDTVTKTRLLLVRDCCEGYARNEDSGSMADNIKCHPVCSEGCENGRCIGPNECVCESGYEYNNGTCKPICRNDCGSHGKCTAPDECECDDGYNYHQDSLLCLPHCLNGCENGTCVSPNKCECENGYKLINESCKPVCKNNCGLNGTCTAPDECLCDHGYKYHPKSLLCVPHCSGGCSHGKCVRPNVCICEDGYELINGTCKPVCKNNCGLNGTCTAPDECLCDHGYKYHPKSLLCVPHCSGGCSHGKCERPNVCICEDGYELINGTYESYFGECEPVCKGNCDFNGICIAPDKCLCYRGFKNDPESPYSCIPDCPQGCENGTCLKPLECVCNVGHELHNGKCKPVCRNRCGLHGTCTAPDECLCDDGYNYHSDTLLCIPHCSDGCDNGTCARPNECECTDGYELVNGKCQLYYEITTDNLEKNYEQMTTEIDNLDDYDGRTDSREITSTYHIQDGIDKNIAIKSKAKASGATLWMYVGLPIAILALVAFVIVAVVRLNKWNFCSRGENILRGTSTGQLIEDTDSISIHYSSSAAAPTCECRS